MRNNYKEGSTTKKHTTNNRRILDSNHISRKTGGRGNVQYFCNTKVFIRENKPKNSIWGAIAPESYHKKKKMKEEIISAFSKENLTATLTPANPEAYYSNNETFEEILGIEIQYEEKAEI